MTRLKSALALLGTGALALGSLSLTPALASAAAGPSGTLTIGTYEEPANLNPILGPSQTFTGLVEGPMDPNLFSLTPQGQLQPDLVTAVPSQANGGVSKNNLVYTFHLRPHVRWSDGAPFTAQDVIETWKLLVNPHVNAVTTEGFTDIKSMTAPDPLTVVMTLYKPYAPFLSTCWSNSEVAIIPAHVFDKVPPSQVNYFQYNVDPTPTLGPYKFVSWTHAQSIVETVNPYYWGPKPHIQKLVFQIIPDQNTLLSALQAGNINLYYFAPVTQLSTLKSMKGVTVYEYNQGGPGEWAQLNLHNPILADVNVRRALEYGIDRQAIVKYVWNGLATLSADTQGPAQWSFDPAVKPYPYSPKLAEQLLQKDGLKVGPGGIRVKNGKQLVLTYSTTAGNTWRAETEQIVQQELQQIGVKIVVHNCPANTFFGTILYKGQFQIAEYQATPGPDPDLRTYRADSCQAFPPYGSNYGFWCNKTVNSLLAQEEQITSVPARKAIFAKIAQIENQQMPSLFYYVPKAIDATYGLGGYQPNSVAPVTSTAAQWTLTQ